MRPNVHSHNLTLGDRQPHDAEGPVFREPWEASAFAIVVKLSEAGHFTWSEWVRYFAEATEKSDADFHRDRQVSVSDYRADDYYHRWFAALERLIIDKRMVDENTINTRHQYLRDNPAPHAHVAQREPIKIA